MAGRGWGISLVGRYYLYRATVTTGFLAPIFTLYLLRDLSFTQVGLLSGLYSVLLVVGEIPTGYVGDRVGRRDSLIASRVAAVASVLGFVVVESFGSYVVVYVLWAVAMTFRSGAGSAWLYDALTTHQRSDDFTRIKGRGDAIAQWASVGMMLAGALLYVRDPRLPFLGGSAVGLIGIALLLSLPRNEGYDDTNSDDALAMDEVLTVLRGTLGRPPVRSFVLFVGLVFGIVGAADQYVQPITVSVLELSLPTLGFGLPPEALLGVLYAAFAGVAAVASFYADRIEARLGIRGTLAAVPVVIVGLFLGAALLPLVALPAFFAMRAGRRLLRPVADGYLNDRIGSAGRATVLSAASMVYGLARTPLVVLAGLAADGWNALAALPALGVVFLVLAGALLAIEPPARDADETNGG